jgi:hypothetical protein
MGKGRIALALNNASTRERIIGLRNFESDIKHCEDKQRCSLMYILVVICALLDEIKLRN